MGLIVAGADLVVDVALLDASATSLAEIKGGLDGLLAPFALHAGTTVMTTFRWTER